MGAETGIEGMVGGVADESSVIGTHGEERGIALNESTAETIVDPNLAAQAAIGIIGGAERIVRFSL